MIRVFVPSTHRSDVIQSGPVADLPSELITYVVPMSETREYTARVRDLGHQSRVLGTDVRGIAGTRRFIGEFCKSFSIEKFIMLDDDIRFLVRRGDDTWRLRGTEKEEAVECLHYVEDFLDDYAHVGVSAREGNNRIGEGGRLSCVSVNTRTLRALAYRTSDFLSVEHGRVEVMEDFDVNLQLLRLGHQNLNIGFWAQGQKMTNAPGGCSTYRTHDLHERSARRLAELHPGVVSLRQKVNKTDQSGFGTRTEVTIQWKRALGMDA